MPARERAGSLFSQRRSLRRPDPRAKRAQKSRPQAAFSQAQRITSRRWQQEQATRLQQEQLAQQLQERKLLQPVQTQAQLRVLARRRPVLALLLFCRKQPGQQQQQWRPERVTCSYREIP
jgi:hypothetical protein